MTEFGDQYDAIVYDLDGTLVRLAVDWETVEREVTTALVDAGADPTDVTTWGLLDLAEAHGIRDTVNEIIASHERNGAENAERLETADALLEDGVPTGVVSLNSESAVRIALSSAGLLDAVEVVIGRDSVTERKPHPLPLLTALERLSVSPTRALFVGDTATDEETAKRAGVAFKRV